VEFPSQFNENWAIGPQGVRQLRQTLDKTGEAMPKALVDKIKKSSKFNQGFMTTEYLAAALLDLQWHMLPADAPLQDPEKFEKAALANYGWTCPWYGLAIPHVLLQPHLGWRLRRRATTPTSGPKCWRPMPSTGSRSMAA
jgi:hypothetical protein